MSSNVAIDRVLFFGSRMPEEVAKSLPVLRKADKAHGLQRRIEGPDVAGRRVLAVEDTSTTGASVLTAVDVLRAAGADVVGVAVIVDRGARSQVTGRGLPYRAAFELADLAPAD